MLSCITRCFTTASDTPGGRPSSTVQLHRVPFHDYWSISRPHQCPLRTRIRPQEGIESSDLHMQHTHIPSPLLPHDSADIGEDHAAHLYFISIPRHPASIMSPTTPFSLLPLHAILRRRPDNDLHSPLPYDFLRQSSPVDSVTFRVRLP